jgi:hypothetical protein
MLENWKKVIGILVTLLHFETREFCFLDASLYDFNLTLTPTLINKTKPVINKPVAINLLFNCRL